MQENYYIEFFEKYILNQHTLEEHNLFLKWFNSISIQEAKQIMDYYAQMPSKQLDFREIEDNSILITKIESRIDQIENTKLM